MAQVSPSFTEGEGRAYNRRTPRPSGTRAPGHLGPHPARGYVEAPAGAVRAGASAFDLFHAAGYLSCSAATPGRVRPSRNSREAPPPVEMWVIRSARPACLTAATESPPPMTLVAPESATAWATRGNAGNSNTPIGPFQTMSFAPFTALVKASTVCGPISIARQPAGMALTATT